MSSSKNDEDSFDDLLADWGNNTEPYPEEEVPNWYLRLCKSMNIDWKNLDKKIDMTPIEETDKRLRPYLQHSRRFYRKFFGISDYEVYKVMNFYFRHLEPRTDFSFWRCHHFFTGYLIAIAGFYGVFNLNPYLGLTASIFGLWIVADDILQHFTQRKQISMYGYYTLCTFWHWAPNWFLYKLTGKLKFKSEIGDKLK
jgi:hypothetical protein